MTTGGYPEGAGSAGYSKAVLVMGPSGRVRRLSRYCADWEEPRPESYRYVGRPTFSSGLPAHLLGLTSSNWGHGASRGTALVAYSSSSPVMEDLHPSSPPSPSLQGSLACSLREDLSIAPHPSSALCSQGGPGPGKWPAVRGRPQAHVPRHRQRCRVRLGLFLPLVCRRRGAGVHPDDSGGDGWGQGLRSNVPLQEDGPFYTAYLPECFTPYRFCASGTIRCFFVQTV